MRYSHVDDKTANRLEAIDSITDRLKGGTWGPMNQRESALLSVIEWLVQQMEDDHRVD